MIEGRQTFCARVIKALAPWIANRFIKRQADYTDSMTKTRGNFNLGAQKMTIYSNRQSIEWLDDLVLYFINKRYYEVEVIYFYVLDWVCGQRSGLRLIEIASQQELKKKTLHQSRLHCWYLTSKFSAYELHIHYFIHIGSLRDNWFDRLQMWQWITVQIRSPWYQPSPLTFLNIIKIK